MKDKMFFETIGKDISTISTMQEVLEVAGLNYTVTSENIYLKDMTMIPERYANVRKDINKVLGVVGKNYNIVQNEDGFSFVKELIEKGFSYLSAGTFNEGAGAFIVLSGKTINVENEVFTIMLLITNSFDGSGAIKVEFTPIRNLCKSTLLLNEKGIDTKISLKHCSQSKDGISEVTKILQSYDKYVKYFQKTISLLINTELKNYSLDKFIQELVPINESSSNIIKARTKAIQEEVVKLYNNITNTGDNAYRLLLSVADYESHRQPLRDTGNPEIYLDRVMDGMWFTNEAFKLIKKRLL